MTREEAIKILEYPVKKWSMEWDEREDGLSYYEALDMAISALRQQEPNDWICTLKCTALMDEGMCSHGGLCCLYESQRTIKENQPLTLDELREAAQTGDPVWLVRANCSSWVVIEKVDDRKYIQLVDYAEFGSDEPYDFAISDYGDSFKAYRQKPEEGTR